MLDTFVKRYSQRDFRFTTAVRHQGRVVALALAVDSGDRPQIYYSVLDPGAAAAESPAGSPPSSSLDVNAWSPTPVVLPFPNEVAQVGYGVMDQTLVPVHKKGVMTPEPAGASVPASERDQFLSSTARLTATQPFEAMSDGQHIYVFRQAVAAGDPNGLTKTGADGSAVTDAEGKPVPLVDATLLVDRFLLTGRTLQPVREVRFQRSRSKTRPQSRRDSLGDKDLDGNPFVEPTLELSFVNRLRDGRFTVLMVPTLVAGMQRWHILTHNDRTGRIDAYSLERSADGLFNPRGTQFYTSPDPDHVADVFEARPGTDPFTGEDLVPFVENEGHAESALEFDGEAMVAFDGGVDLGREFALEAWIFPRTPTGEHATEPQRLFGAGKTVAGSRRTKDTPLSVWIESFNRLRIGFGSDGGWAEHLTPRILTLEAWNHVAMTFDGAVLRTYVNGRLRDLTEDAAVFTGGKQNVDDFGEPLRGSLAMHTPGAPLSAIGGSTAGFQGMVDEVRVWRRNRGRRELGMQMGRRLVGNELGLAAYWRCDEASGDRVFDQTDEQIDGTQQGCAWVTSDAPIGTGTGLTRNSFALGSDDGSGGTAILAVDSGLSAVLYHQQADVASGYDGSTKKLKQNARVMLAVATRAPGAARSEIAVLDLGVTATGRLADIPDVARLDRLERQGTSFGTLNDAFDRLTDLEKEKLDLDLQIDEIDERVALIGPAATDLETVLADPAAAVTAILDGPYAYVGEAMQRHAAAWAGLQQAQSMLDAFETQVASAQATFFRDAYFKVPMLTVGVGRYEDLGSAHKQISSFTIDPLLDVILEIEPDGVYLFHQAHDWLGAYRLSDGTNLNDRVVAVQVMENAQVGAKRAPLQSVRDTATAVYDAVRAELVQVQGEIAAELAQLAAERAAATARLTTVMTEIADTTSEIHMGAAIRMPLVAIDAAGLTITGASLGFAWTKDTPRLFDSAMGSVAMYFRGERDQFFVAYYSAFTARAKYSLAGFDGRTSVECQARSADPDMDKIEVEVRSGADSDHCTVVIANLDVEETWTQVPRTPETMAAILNGTASIREYVGTGTAERVDGMTVALNVPGGIGRSCEAGITLVIGKMPVLVAKAFDSGAERIEVTTPDGQPPTEALPIYYLPYDYDRHAATTRVPSDLYNGSLLVNAARVTDSPIVDQKVVGGTTLSSHWTAGVPGNTLAFNGKSTLARPATGPFADALDVGDDLTIETWLRPADVDERMRIVRHKSSPESEYSLGLEPARAGMKFDGSSDFVTHTVTREPKAGAWSVELWFRADRTEGENFLYSKANYGAAVRNGFLQFRWAPSSAWQGGEAFAVTPGRWYHLAIVHQPFGGGLAAQIMYRNGRLLTVSHVSGAVTAGGPGPLVVGAESASGGHFAGAIAELRAWARALTPAEIEAHRMTQVSSNATGLAAYWRYDRLNRGRVMDLTSGRQHGAVSGNPVAVTTYDVFAGVNGRYAATSIGFEAGHWAHFAASFRQSYAVEFEGRDAHLHVPHAQGLDLTGDLTIEAVVRALSWSKPQGLVAKGALGESTPVPYALAVAADGRLLFTVVDEDGQTHSVRSMGALKPDTSHHIAVTRRRRTETIPLGKDENQTTYTLAWDDVDFFVDGKRDPEPQILSSHRTIVAAAKRHLAGEAGAEDAFKRAAGSERTFAAISIRGNEEPVEIGRLSQSGVFEIGSVTGPLAFSGVMSDLRLSRRALDSEEIGATGGGGEGLVAWWPFEERSGTTAQDAAGTNHATYSGKVTAVKDPDPTRAALDMYRNGSPVATISASGAVAGYGGGVRQSTIGGLKTTGDDSEHYRGELDELRIWQVPRTLEQVQDNLFRHLTPGTDPALTTTGEQNDLIAYYGFDAQTDGRLADKGPRGVHLDVEKGSYVLSTAPVGVDAPHIRSALGGVKTAFHGTVHSQPGVAEYADVAYDAEGNIVGTFKRCYVSIENQDWHLVTGFKIGDLTTDWIGQVQFAPQLIGYIEGAPPVPSENLTATGYVRGEFAEYVNASGVELSEAASTTHRYAAEKETGADLDIDVKLGGIIGAEAHAGLFLVVKTLDVENVIGFHGNFETSWGWLAETSTSVGRATKKAYSVGLRGSVENESAIEFPAVGRRFAPDNVGMAFVTSETADLFALRLAHNGALVSFQIRPNPDIPPDQNIITFPINPRYTKQGSLDGKIGFEPDPNYPNALTYSSDLSYFKPVEAYALLNEIEKDTAMRRTRYQQYDASGIGRQGPAAGASLEERLRSPSAAEHKRSLANRYVWTADGGLYAESEETLESRSETLGGSFSFKGMGGLYTDLTFAFGGFGLKFELDLMVGGHMNRTVTKSEESETSFGLEVDLGGVESDTYLRDADGELVMDLGDPRNPRPMRQPGRVDAYRFMSFYLEPAADHFNAFFNKVVDPIWLEQSSDPSAAALREARQDAKRPPAWRIMHRVTYVSRVLPAFTDDAPPSLEKTMRSLEIDSNYELIRMLEPFVADRLTSEEEFSLAVSDAVGTYLPELKPHLPEIKSYLRLFLGVGRAGTLGDDAGEISVVERAADQPPMVNAGLDQVVGLSGSSVPAMLEATIIDDRYDKTNAIFATWKRAEGPSTVRFDDPHAPDTTARFADRGRYVLRMTADDGRSSSEDDVVVTVNVPPIVHAGPRQELRPSSGRKLRAEIAADDAVLRWFDTQLAVDSDRAIARLEGVVADDGLGDPPNGKVTTRWTKVSGAGDVEISPDGRFASFSESGHYLLRFSADNETFAVDSDVVIAVAARVTGGLVALYTFQEGDGEVVHDVSGIDEPCDLTIGNTAAVHWNGGSLELDAPGTLAANGQSARINRQVRDTGELTVEAWLKPSRPAPDGLGRIVTLSTGPGERNLTLGQTEDAFHLAVRTSATNANASDVALTVPGSVRDELCHVAATRAVDGTTRFYIDGVMVAERTIDGDLSNWLTDAPLAVGNEPNGGASEETSFLGALHLVALYNRALAPEEVEQNWRYGADTDLPPVVMAGADRVVDSATLPAKSTLSALVVHDRPTHDATAMWMLVTGPADVDLDDPSSVTPELTMPVPGVYQMRLSVEAGGAMTSDELEIVVNTMPTIELAAEETVSLPDEIELVGQMPDNGLGSPDQGEVTVGWSLVDGPGEVAFTTPSRLQTTARFASHGPHRIALTVNNGHFAATREMTVKVFDKPRISATAPAVVTLDETGSATVALAGEVVDPGLGDPAAPVLVGWTTVSGPSVPAISASGELQATATVHRNGEYVFELSVNNSRLTSTASIAVTINQPPTVDAGPPRTVVLPNLAIMDATVGDDGLPRDPGRVVIRWDQVEGPGLTSFEDDAVDLTRAHFSRPGTYRLRVRADDGDAESEDSVVVEALRPPRIDFGLVAHYRFDEGEGTTVRDVSNVADALDLNIGASTAAEWVESGLRISGATPLTSGSAARLVEAMSDGGGSIEAVISPGSGMTLRRNVTAHVVTLTAGGRPQVMVEHDDAGITGSIVTGRRGRGNRTSVSAIVPAPPARIHVAYTFDLAAGETRIYIDGIPIATQDYSGSWPASASGDVVLSVVSGDGGADWLGTLHGVAIYGRVLTAEEVLTNFFADMD